MKRLALVLTATTALAGIALAQTEQPAQSAQTTKSDESAAKPLTVSMMAKQKVYTADGSEAGQIVDVVAGQDGQNYAIVAPAQGSDKQVMVPLSSISYENDRFILTDTNAQQLASMPPYKK